VKTSANLCAWDAFARFFFFFRYQDNKSLLQLASFLETFGTRSRTITSTKTATYNITIVLKLQKQRLNQTDQQGHDDLQLADFPLAIPLPQPLVGHRNRPSPRTGNHFRASASQPTHRRSNRAPPATGRGSGTTQRQPGSRSTAGRYQPAASSTNQPTNGRRGSSSGRRSGRGGRRRSGNSLRSNTSRGTQRRAGLHAPRAYEDL
jgi:hypothetical protein